VKKRPSTAICRATNDSVYVRGKNLAQDLIGKIGFVDMMVLDILGRVPSDQERIILDAALVSLMEHGMSPSIVSARLTLAGSPEAFQGAVAAGILGAGSRVLGTVQEVARLLDILVLDPKGVDVAARREVMRLRQQKRQIPGFGHPHHTPDDPRTLALFSLAEQTGVVDKYVPACKALSVIVDEIFEKHLTLNATAAVAAVLREIAMPPETIRGFAIVSRTAGLVAHLYEEDQNPVAMRMAYAAADSVPFEEEKLQ